MSTGCRWQDNKVEQSRSHARVNHAPDRRFEVAARVRSGSWWVAFTCGFGAWVSIVP